MRAARSIAAALAALALALTAPAAMAAAEGPSLSFDLGASFGLPSGLSLLQRLCLRWEPGPVLGLEARIPAASYRMLFPSDSLDEGFRTESFRLLDVDWGLYGGWAFGRSQAWESWLGLSLGGLVSYRSCAYEDEVYGYGGEYSQLSWLREARLVGAASVSLASLTGLRGLEPLRLGIEGGLPLRGPLYMLERWSLGLDLRWRFGKAPAR